MSDVWDDDTIREAFIYDGGASEYHDPVNGAQVQRKVAGALFDRWLAEHDAKVRADTLKGLLSEFGEWADEMTFVVGNELDEDAWRDVTVREYITQCIDEIEKEAGLT